ncbi:MocR-like ectoine utilization transcription factor EhuR [Radicibacter daui]|uniref:MocR-like ectoine utilization transcription factor EhuR n=1 Tax=Radicibacter daui TaxID=3064829 RepID=UPI004046F9F3
MTIWQPDPSKLRRPVYLSLAEEISGAIADGRLANGTKLLPHRRLADDLGISVQTVGRAYEELGRRGLVSGETGRGTFVRTPQREPDPPYIPERLDQVEDLSILKPVCEPMHVEHLQAALADLSRSLDPAIALSFRPNTLFTRHRTVALDWLKLCGIECQPGNVCLTNGATAAMTIALMVAAPPGSTVVTEEIGHHTLVPLAAYLGLKLVGLAIDDDGIVPDALERACREGDVRALYMVPTAANPTATTMSLTRRQQIIEIARRHGLLIVENDALGPLVSERPAPFGALAPDITLYLTTFTKCVMPGLRNGYLVVPDRLVPAAANRHLVTNWMATPLLAEIAARWVEDGKAQQLMEWQRTTLRARQRIAAELLAGTGYCSQPEGLHVWLPLGENRSEAAFVSHARLQNVAIAPGSSFVTSGSQHPAAVRISVGSTSEEGLRRGLTCVVNLLSSEPEPVLLAI